MVNSPCSNSSGIQISGRPGQLSLLLWLFGKLWTNEALHWCMENHNKFMCLAMRPYTAETSVLASFRQRNLKARSFNLWIHWATLHTCFSDCDLIFKSYRFLNSSSKHNWLFYLSQKDKQQVMFTWRVLIRSNSNFVWLQQIITLPWSYISAFQVLVLTWKQKGDKW